MKTARTLLVVGSFCCAFRMAGAQTAVPNGTPTVVNLTVADSQGRPSIARDRLGNIVVVWASLGQDGDGWGVFGRRFDPQGLPIGGEFPVNATTASDQDEPRVAFAPDGSFIVVWTSLGQDGNGRGVYARRFAPNGAPLGGEFRVNTFTTGDQSRPALTIHEDGRFVVVWESFGQDGSGAGVYLQRFSPNGTPFQTALRANAFTPGDQTRPVVASLGQGRVVVVWESAGELRGRRFLALGPPLAADIPINGDPTGTQMHPAIAADRQGNFFVAWSDDSARDGEDGFGIFARRFFPTGVAQGADFHVNTYVMGDQFDPAVTLDPTGQIAVAWTSDGQDGDGEGVFSQVYTGGGASLGGEFRVSTPIPGDEHLAALASHPEGGLVSVWEHGAAFATESSPPGVLFQRFATNRLVNGSFEAPLRFDWLKKGLSPSDTRDCTTALDGGCAFMIAGSSTAKGLVQRVPGSWGPGARFELSASSRSEGTSSTGGDYQLQVTFWSLDGGRSQYTATFTKSDHDWETVRTSFVTDEALFRAEVELRYDNQTGTAWFDEVRLVSQNDTAPAVRWVDPPDGAVDIPANTDVIVEFTEAVDVASGAFSLECPVGSPVNFTVQPGAPGSGSRFVLDPVGFLPQLITCTLRVVATKVTDSDTKDPLDRMVADHVSTFMTINDAPPSVASTNPADGATGIAANTNLVIDFDEPVDVTGNWFQIVCPTSGTRNVADTVVTGGPTSFTIDPNSDFTASEMCTVTVFAAQVTDQDPNDPPDNMLADFVFDFTIDAAPSVAGTTPANGATNQATNTNVTLNFSEAVNVAGNWFQIVCGTSGTRNVADTVVTGGPTSFTIDPNANFAEGETCTVTVFASQVTDQDTGDPPDNMAANHVFSFTTDQAPSVTGTTPANGATNQATNTNVTVNFSEAVNVAGNWFQIVCGVSGTRNVADTVVTGGPTSFTINPNADFAAGETCTATVFASQVTDQDSGDPPDNMAANHVFGFTMDQAPSVTGTTPANGATNQATNTNLAVNFSEAVNVAGNWFQIVCPTSGTRNVADTVVTGGPTSFTINPNADFAEGETCTVTVFAAQVTDQDTGDPPDNMAGNHVFGFTMDQAPSVTGTTPANGATNQATNTNLTVNFSEAVNVAGNWFQIVCPTSGTRNVADTVVTGGPTSFTINPNADFAPGETCTTTVFAAQVTDQDSGDPPDNMAANHVFSFTMDQAPSVSSTTPANGATDQATNVNLAVNFSEAVNVTGNWFQIVCPTSGTRNVADTVVTGGPTSFTINPNADFAAAETCTVTAFAAQVADQDANDPPDNMVANHVFSFTMDQAPSVSSTTPVNGATNQATNTNVSLNFSEAVNVAGNWFQIVCGVSGTRNVADTVVTGGPISFTINPNADFAAGETCTTTVFAAQVADQDGNDPPDNMAANHVFSFTMDAAPSVVSTTPADGAVNQPKNTNITLTFSENVNVAGNWFQIVCGATTVNVADTVVTGGPLSFTINPNADLPAHSNCTVTVFAAQVTDQDAADPPDTMAANHSFSFTTANTPPTADNDDFDTIGNTELRVDLAAAATPHVLETTPSTFGVLDGDADPDGDTISVAGIVGCADVTPPFLCTTTNNGSVTMESNGRFSFLPAAGDVAASDSFQYDVSDGFGGTTTATVTISRFERVWYVRNDAAAGGLGRSSDPFDTLAEAQTASSPNDWIFVYFGDGTTTGQSSGIALKNGQHLIGEHAGLSIAVNLNGNGSPTNLVTPVPGNRPMLDDTVVDAVEGVHASNAIPTEIVALNLAGNVNAINLTMSGAFGGSGALTISDNVIRQAAVEGIDVNAGGTGTLTLRVHDNQLTATGTAVDILRTNGTLIIAAFDDNTVSGDTGGSGIVVTGPATFDADPVAGGLQQVSGGDTNVGISGNGVGGAGVMLSNVSGDLNFTNFSINADGGAALSVAGTGAFTGAAGTRVGLSATGELRGTSGPAADLSNLTAALPLSTLVSNNSATTGVRLVGVGGTFSAGLGNSIANATGTDFVIDGANANVTYNGTITDDVGTLVSIANTAGGTKGFGGAISDGNDGDGSGISLTSNTGSLINFSGGLTLSTGANPAFTATGGGTVNVTDPAGPAANTIATTTGTALNVANTTVGASGLTFQSISANGAANGIVLNNTGAVGGLSVTGTGGSGTGGTIQNTTGAGISLTSTRSIALSSVNVVGTGGHGIDAVGVNGLTLTGCQVTGAGNADNEHGLNLVNGTGTVTIDGTSFSNAAEDLVHVDNTNTNLTLNVQNSSQFSYPGAVSAFANDAFLIFPNGTSAITASVQNSTFTDIPGQAVQMGAATLGSNGTSSLTFSGNTSTVNLANRASGVFVSGQESTTTNITIQNNTFTGAGGNGVISLDGNDSSTLKGTMSGNTITNPPGIGIFLAVDEGAMGRIVVDNNSITNAGGDGIETVNFGGVGVSTSDFVITNNVVNDSNQSAAQAFLGGIVFIGFEDSACIVDRGNTVTGSHLTNCGGPCVDHYLEEVGGTTLLEEVPDTVATTATPVYVQSINNPPAATALIFGTIDLTNGAICPRP